MILPARFPALPGWDVLRMLGGTDTAFGSTGTLSSAVGTASFNFYPQMGRPGLITKDTPLHFGALDL